VPQIDERLFAMGTDRDAGLAGRIISATGLREARLDPSFGDSRNHERCLLILAG